MYKTHTKLNEDTLLVVIEGSEQLCNTLRQIISNNVPTYAIEILTVEYNDSSIITENILKQRIGLVPVIMNPKDNDYKDIDFSLDITSNEPIMNVYTNHFNSELLASNIQLSVLTHGQRLKIKAKAIVSTGDDHSKWSPVCAPTFIDLGQNLYSLRIESKGSRKPDIIYNEAIDILHNQLLDIVIKLENPNYTL